MSVLAAIRTRLLAHHADAGNRGIIGIEFGRSTIRFAQLQRCGDVVHFAHRWLYSLSAEPDSAHNPHVHELTFLSAGPRRLAAIRKMFAGRRCAAVVPPSLVSMRSFELPAADDAALRDMVREELAADGDSEAAGGHFDFWKYSEPGAAMCTVTAVTLAEQVAKRVAHHLARAGLDCNVIDGLPCAMARAVTLIEQTGRPTAVIDLADDAITFVIVADSQPAFSRVLRGGGLQHMLAPLKQGLRLTQEQCIQLLAHRPLSASDVRTAAPPAAALQLLANPLRQLVDELERSLDFVAQQSPQLKPVRMYMTGDGALIQNLELHLSQFLKLEVIPWSLPGSDSPLAGDARFAIAAALSALPWEQNKCE